MLKQLMYEDIKIMDIFIADTFVKRFLGYMFQKKPHYDAILLKPCSSIHTYFMKFDIDVLFLDSDMNIIKKIEKLQPNKIIGPVKNAALVIEAEAGVFVNIKVSKKLLIK